MVTTEQYLALSALAYSDLTKFEGSSLGELPTISRYPSRLNCPV